jgi:hypothetical protein
MHGVAENERKWRYGTIDPACEDTKRRFSLQLCIAELRERLADEHRAFDIAKGDDNFTIVPILQLSYAGMSLAESSARSRQCSIGTFATSSRRIESALSEVQSSSGRSALKEWCRCHGEP